MDEGPDPTWRPIPDLDRPAEASDTGLIRIRYRQRKRLATPLVTDGWIDRDGRRCVRIRVGKCVITRPVEYLVAAAFMGPMPAGDHVAHIDGNVRNNALANLRFAPYVPGRWHGKTFPQRAVLPHQCREMRERYSQKQRVQEIAAIFGASRWTAWRIIFGVTHQLEGGPIALRMRASERTGLKNGNGKYSKRTVARIRRLLRGNLTQKQVASKTGVSLSHVQKIAQGKRRTRRGSIRS